MTLFQARYIQWMTFKNYSLRAISRNYYSRYNTDGTQKEIKTFHENSSGNQMDGIFLRREAIRALKRNNIEPLFDEMGALHK